MYVGREIDSGPERDVRVDSSLPPQTSPICSGS